MIAKIATGEVEDETPKSQGKASARAGGLKGGKARAMALSPKERADIAKIAAGARWKKA
jgi:hypothetical protein